MHEGGRVVGHAVVLRVTLKGAGMSELGSRVGDFVSGGYFIVKPAPRAPCMDADLLADVIVTATDCIVDLVPESWSIEWSSDTEAARREKGAKFGLEGVELRAFMGWCTSALESGELGWPGVFLDVDVAIRVKREFLSRSTDLVVIGICLPHDLVSGFLDETRPEAGQGEPGVVAALRSARAPFHRGQPLGYDVLGWEFGGCGFHSYICNGLQRDFAKLLGIRPNRWGFFDLLGDARRCADHCNLEATGAEPGIWMPWRVALHDGSLGDDARSASPGGIGG